MASFDRSMTVPRLPGLLLFKNTNVPARFAITPDTSLKTAVLAEERRLGWAGD